MPLAPTRTRKRELSAPNHAEVGTKILCWHAQQQSTPLHVDVDTKTAYSTVSENTNTCSLLGVTTAARLSLSVVKPLSTSSRTRGGCLADGGAGTALVAGRCQISHSDNTAAQANVTGNTPMPSLYAAAEYTSSPSGPSSGASSPANRSALTCHVCSNGEVSLGGPLATTCKQRAMRATYNWLQNRAVEHDAGVDNSGCCALDSWSIVLHNLPRITAHRGELRSTSQRA